jgi:pimeloyl-ACP methyl ester carboxylesterase
MGWWSDVVDYGKKSVQKVGEVATKVFVSNPIAQTFLPLILSSDNSIASWQNKSIDKNAKTYVVIHGYLSSANEQWVQDIEASLAEDKSANVLSLDWLGGNFIKSASNKYYSAAASRTESAGEQLAQYLKDQGIDSDNVTIVGHSLGAQVAAFASQESLRITGKKFDKIIGLDPAGPNFGAYGNIGNNIQFGRIKTSPYGLNDDSARRVIALHTSDTLGVSYDVGALDVYVNRQDSFQPESSTAIGNHSYAHQLYIKLLKGEKFRQSDGTFFDLNSLDNSKKTVNVSTTNSFSGLSLIKSEISGVDFSDIFQADDSLIFQVKTTNSCRGQATHSVSVSKNALIEIDQAADQLSEEYSFGIMTQSTSTPFDAKTLWNEKVLALSSTNSEASHFFDNIDIV